MNIEAGTILPEECKHKLRGVSLDWEGGIYNKDTFYITCVQLNVLHTSTENATEHSDKVSASIQYVHQRVAQRHDLRQYIYMCRFQLQEFNMPHIC